MGKITLENGKGQKIELIFQGKAIIKAHKENKGIAFFGKDYYFVETDQKYEEELKPGSN